ncbi:hypothetical protein BU26DRAFT_106437 [Trematosphaeria pertusa]|uniref:Secreted protein n=1 Tax=Trematosphaeria pertusa TaxID=390896 RepID=A0A6A6I0X4_9PLEO|nr:uncharacterized protein BU26DRAFT_106437 [Trematosphaeria pertusa]KAF2243658.1 hypothetical protein BU26DRAFT_106437 [Trematosphaeria pertusa]
MMYHGQITFALCILLHRCSGVAGTSGNPRVCTAQIAASAGIIDGKGRGSVGPERYLSPDIIYIYIFPGCCALVTDCLRI